MIFDSADLLHVPWEILIKGFRDKLARKTFNELEGYADEFFSFLDGNTQYFPEQVQTDELYNGVERASFQLIFRHFENFPDLETDAGQEKLAAAIAARSAELEEIAPPLRIAADQAQKIIAAQRDAIAQRFPPFLKVSDALRQSLAELGINEVFKRSGQLLSTAGLVFAGFGDHEIFPKMIAYRSTGMLDNTLIIAETERATVDHNLPATLNAFAQTSMADTFSLGFSSDVYSALMNTLRAQLKDFAAAICGALQVDVANVPNLADLVGAARTSISEGWFESARKDHSYPLRRVLGALPVEEMAELAETLVNLQSLKEKVTKPSASVGGPVDVAIITKNEGLVWAKRKLFFDANLNSRYFDRQREIYQ